MTMPPIRVLVMDNSVDTLEVLRSFLEFEGFAVETCNTAKLRSEGADLAAAIAAARPDVVVFDIAMPYDVNWQVCETLKRDSRVAAPFVLTTTNRTAVERLTEARDVIEVLGKPYDLGQFARAIRRAVERDQADNLLEDRRADADRRAGDRRHAERRHDR